MIASDLVYCYKKVYNDGKMRKHFFHNRLVFLNYGGKIAEYKTIIFAPIMRIVFDETRFSGREYKSEGHLYSALFYAWERMST